MWTKMPGRDDEKVKRPLYLGADNFLQSWAVAVALIQCYLQANWSAISSQPHQRLNPGRWDVQGLAATQSPTTIVENAAAAMVENAFHLNFDNIYDSSAMRWNQPSAIRGGVDFCYILLRGNANSTVDWSHTAVQKYNAVYYVVNYRCV